MQSFHTRTRKGRWRLTATALLGAALALVGCKEKNAETASSVNSPVARYDRFQAVTGNGSISVAVGAFGVVETSADAGKSWTRTVLPGAPGLIAVAACGDGSFAALDGGAGTVWRADAQGKGWSMVKVDRATDTLLDLTCTTDNQLWTVGARGLILTSSDAGKSWASRSLDEDLQLLNIAFPAAGHGVITGEFGRVLVSTDSGKNWTASGSLGESFYPFTMSFSDPQHGIVGGIGGVLMETSDGGASWTRAQAPTPAPVYGVRLHSDGSALVVGAGGTALQRQGGAWSPLPGLPKTDMRGLAETSSGVIIAGTGVLASVSPPSSSAPAR